MPILPKRRRFFRDVFAAVHPGQRRRPSLDSPARAAAMERLTPWIPASTERMLVVGLQWITRLRATGRFQNRGGAIDAGDVDRERL